MIHALVGASLAGTLVVSPGEDWCGAVNAAAAGDSVVLRSGEHAGPCTIRASGAAGSPITVRGEDPSSPPQIVYEGSSSNVIDVQASHVSIVGLAFGPTRPDIDGVKIKSGSWITVEGNQFTGMGGISVSANSADSEGVAILANRFSDLEATALYLGCHDGAGACVASDLRVEGNLIDGVRSDGVGYGLEIKKDSWGSVRDNVIHDTQGPGIEVFGSEDAAAASLVDGNLVVRSVDNASIEVGGPHVTVTNNVVVGGGDGGIYVYAYWDSVHDVVVAGNTVVGEAAQAVRVASGASAIVLADNAGYQERGPGPFPGAMGGVSAEGNVRCETPEACWVDGPAWDFEPVDGALTTDGGAAPSLTVDFCGRTRGAIPTVGAFEAGHPGAPGPLRIDFKTTFPCGDGGGTDTGPTDSGTTDSGDSGGADSGGSDSGTTPTVDSGAEDPPPEDTAAPAGAACGCAAAGAPGGWVAFGIGLLAVRRRRPRR